MFVEESFLNFELGQFLAQVGNYQKQIARKEQKRLFLEIGEQKTKQNLTGMIESITIFLGLSNSHRHTFSLYLSLSFSHSNY